MKKELLGTFGRDLTVFKPEWTRYKRNIKEVLARENVSVIGKEMNIF
jgi:hypothetical protein